MEFRALTFSFKHLVAELGPKNVFRDPLGAQKLRVNSGNERFGEVPIVMVPTSALQ
jgi:hypothetical protein